MIKYKDDILNTTKPNEIDLNSVYTYTQICCLLDIICPALVGKLLILYINFMN